jgi:hypothetical protein
MGLIYELVVLKHSSYWDSIDVQCISTGGHAVLEKEDPDLSTTGELQRMQL